MLTEMPFDLTGCTGLVCVLTKKQDSSVFMGGLACQQVIELPVRLDDMVDFMSEGGGLQTLTRFVVKTPISSTILHQPFSSVGITLI